MDILLINTNPVISRLLVLCTRDDDFHLEEVSHVQTAQRKTYTIVFVDADSCDDEVLRFLSGLEQTVKVFISYEDVQEPGFDVNIRKPFLPSQIIALIEEAKGKAEAYVVKKPFIFPLAQEESPEEGEDPSIEETMTETSKDNVEKSLVEEATQLLEISEVPDEEKIYIEENSEEVEGTEEEVENEPLENQPLTVLNVDEIEKIKALLDMDDESELPEELLSEEEIEVRKREVITEQLIAEGLEIVEENKMLDEIVEEMSVNLDASLEEKKKKKSKKIKFTEENMEHIEDAVEMAMANMTRKQMKKLLKGKAISIDIKLEGRD